MTDRTPLDIFKRSADEVLADVVDGVGYLTLARPSHRNAISAAMMKRLRAALVVIDADERVQVLVLRSSVDGMFCAGADIQGLADPDPEALRGEFQLLIDVVEDIRALSKPVVAVIAGTCIGAGCALAAAADIVLAAEDAKFCLPEVHLDIAPVLAMQALYPVVHLRQLLFWSATGRMFSAREALDGGLVTLVTPSAGLPGELSTLLGELKRPASATFRYLKRAAKLLEQPKRAGVQQELMATMLASASSAEARIELAGFRARKRKQST